MATFLDRTPLTEVRKGDIVEWAAKEWEVMGLEASKAVLRTDGGYEYKLPVVKLMQQAQLLGDEPDLEWDGDQVVREVDGYKPTEHMIIEGTHANVLTGYVEDMSDFMQPKVGFGDTLNVESDYLASAVEAIRFVLESLRRAMDDGKMSTSEYSLTAGEAIDVEAVLVKAVRNGQ